MHRTEMPAPIADTTYVLPIRRTTRFERRRAGGVSRVARAAAHGGRRRRLAAGCVRTPRATWPRSVQHVAGRRGPAHRSERKGRRRRHRPAPRAHAEGRHRRRRRAPRRLHAAPAERAARPRRTSCGRRTCSCPRRGTPCSTSGRTLIARATGGDWPGTLGVRMDAYAARGRLRRRRAVREPRARPHDPCRGRARARRRTTSSCRAGRRRARHFLSQRVRQAYDELARPSRLAAQLAHRAAAARVARAIRPARARRRSPLGGDRACRGGAPPRRRYARVFARGVAVRARLDARARGHGVVGAGAVGMRRRAVLARQVAARGERPSACCANGSSSARRRAERRAAP